MSRLPHVKSFRDLIVYKKSRTLAGEIFELTKGFPQTEMYSLTDQIRRSSRSVGAQIAKAWGKRRYEKHFISKLTDADGEQQETQHWIEIAFDCGYLTKNDKTRLLQGYEEIGRLLGGMMTKAAKFSNPQAIIREDAPQYFLETDPITG